ncbi:MAG: response regulator transcription factor [Bacteroidales bacterium]
MKTILIIEDDVSILEGLKDNLEFEGYEVISETNGTRGLHLAKEKDVALLLLDIMLPGTNGYDICRSLKKMKPDLPILMLTARGSEMDKVWGLDIGADDYITKPFSLPELLARIRAALRKNKTEPVEYDIYSFGNIKLDFKKMIAFRGEERVLLSSREFDLMKYLIKHEGEAVHRHDLLNEVWGYQAMPTTRTVDNFILDLRKKMEEDPSHPRHFVSVRGIGYRFDSGNP